MKTYTEEVGHMLNTILEKNYDAQKGYETAASNTSSTILRNFFDRKSEQRKLFTIQLKSELKNLSQEPDTNGSIIGAIHRTWMNAKALFSGSNDEAMLQEAIRGEKASIEDYNDVLNSELYLPESIKDILIKQRDTIIKDTLTIKKLEDIQ